MDGGGALTALAKEWGDDEGQRGLRDAEEQQEGGDLAVRREKSVVDGGEQ